MLASIESTVEQVRPVVRPLFSTWMLFRLAAVSTSPVPAKGGAAAIWLRPPAPAPNALIEPVVSTFAEVVLARAASTLAEASISGTQYCKGAMERMAAPVPFVGVGIFP